MEAYLDAKLMLFDGRNGAPAGKRARAVVYADDPSAPRVAAAARRAGLEVIRCGFDRDLGGSAGSAGEKLDVSVVGLETIPRGLVLRILVVTEGTGNAEILVRLPMLGRYNASNAVAAIAAALALGIAPDQAARGLEALEVVPGRLEIVAADPLVVVDYAHTPDALERALAAVREHAAGRLLLVFGCGGDRDRGKRPLMGRAAAAGADRAWVTSDNPRGEDPAAIAREVVAGAEGAGLAVELDRRAAIAAALAEARSGDAVLIAGKGHETTQTIGTRTLPFDDRLVARELLAGGGR
jgi:UDP-N-acetylmuramoyl-L-alanyl-D-glutamate--2,6-diaminopimelate ligase